MATYSELRRGLNRETVAKLYLLLGPEEFLARRLTSQLIDVALGDGMKDFNYVEIDAPNVDAPNLLQELNVYPLGASRRVILIRHIGSLNAAAEKALQDSLENLPDFLTLILTADRLDRRKTLYKNIASHGVVVELGPLPPYEVKEWIREMIQERGKRVEPRLVDSIYALTGNDLSEVANEVNNLLEYLGERETVTQEDVDTLIVSRRKEPIYMLTEAVAEKNYLGAWLVLRQLLSEGESELRILWHLDMTVKRLLRGKCLLEDGMSGDAMIKVLQIRPFLKARFLQQLRSFSMDDLRKMYHTILVWDNKFKSTSRWHPEIDLELLVLELCTT